MMYTTVTYTAIICMKGMQAKMATPHAIETCSVRADNDHNQLMQSLSENSSSALQCCVDDVCTLAAQ